MVQFLTLYFCTLSKLKTITNKIFDNYLRYGKTFNEHLRFSAKMFVKECQTEFNKIRCNYETKYYVTRYKHKKTVSSIGHFLRLHLSNFILNRYRNFSARKFLLVLPKVNIGSIQLVKNMIKHTK